jgi:SAM-dependent methyltransferase
MDSGNQAQIEQWDGRVGAKWAEMQGRLDAMLAGATAALVEAIGPVAGLNVLDIGCGSGVTTERLLEGGASVTGVDVSEPLLAAAALRTGGRATLVRADASAWRGEAPFDMAVSQFGVMFFADPVAAFRNIGTNLKPGARLVFCCWRPVTDNPWVTVPMGAVRDLLPEAPPPVPHAPGPFGLADRARTEGILAEAGFTGVTIRPAEIGLEMAAAGGVDKALELTLQIGPVASALAEADEAVKAEAKARLRAALAPFAHDGRVEFPGAIWLAEAVRGPEFLS